MDGSSLRSTLAADIAVGDRLAIYSARRKGHTTSRVIRVLAFDGVVNIWLEDGGHQRVPAYTRIDIAT